MANFDDLATVEEVFNKTKKLRKLTQSECEDLREWAFDEIGKFKSVLTQYFTKNDWVDDTEIYSARLLNLHLLNSSLIGLVTGLQDRNIYLVYKDLTEKKPSDGSKGLAGGDRKIYAEGESADLKGLAEDLKETQKNLWQRIVIFKDRR